MRPIDAEALKTKIQKIKAEALEHGFAPESVCGDIFLNFLDNAPTIEVVPKELYEQILWERNIAMEQLEEHGIGFASKGVRKNVFF